MAKTKRTPKKTGKIHSFKFSTAGLVSLGLFSLMVLIWIFIFGVLVGRGYRPEVLIPQLSRVLPEAKTQVDPPTPPPPAQTRRYDVLTAEELDFHETLQPNPPAHSTDRTEAPASRKAQKSARSTASTPPDTPPGPEETQASTETADPRFRFVYQVGSFKSPAQARVNQDLLRSRGLDASISQATVQGASWHRIEVAFSGTESEARAFRERLRSLGISEAFLRSKKQL